LTDGESRRFVWRDEVNESRFVFKKVKRKWEKLDMTDLSSFEAI